MQHGTHAMHVQLAFVSPFAAAAHRLSIDQSFLYVFVTINNQSQIWQQGSADCKIVKDFIRVATRLSSIKYDPYELLRT